MPRQYNSTTNSAGPLVYEALVIGATHRCPAIRQHFHRNVLYLYELLELQVLLRVWIHDAGLSDSCCRINLHDHSGHLLFAERRKLSLAMDKLHGFRFYFLLRFRVLHILLLLENQDERFLADSFLLRIYGPLLCGFFYHVRYRRPRWEFHLREAHL